MIHLTVISLVLSTAAVDAVDAAIMSNWTLDLMRVLSLKRENPTWRIAVTMEKLWCLMIDYNIMTMTAQQLHRC